MPPKRDSRLVVDPVHARVVRPPCASDPRPYWRAEIFKDGKKIPVWTGRGTREEVRAVLTEKVQRGELGPQDANAGPVGSVTDLLERWVGSLLEELGEHDSTFKAYRGRARALKATIGDVRLDRVTPATMQDHVAARARDGVRSTSIGNEIVVFGAAWRWGYELGLVVAKDPPTARPNKRRRRGRRRQGEGAPVSDHRPKYTPSDAEVAAVLRHLPGWARMVGLILTGTGMRIGEVANLTWGDVDLERGLLHVRDVSGNKTGERVAPILLVGLVEELAAWRPEGARAEDRVVPVSRRTVANNWSALYLPKACAAAKVPKITAHAFRRYVTDRYAREGIDYMTSGKAMGNSPATQAKHYRTVTVDDMQRAAKQARLRLPKAAGRVVSFPGRKVTG